LTSICGRLSVEAMEGLGRTLLAVGLLIAFVGLGLMFGPKELSLGRLPGDIVIRRPGFTLYLPLGTGLLLSLLLTLALWLFRRGF